MEERTGGGGLSLSTQGIQHLGASTWLRTPSLFPEQRLQGKAAAAQAGRCLSLSGMREGIPQRLTKTGQTDWAQQVRARQAPLGCPL